jgi:hypothetical protein
MKIPFDFKLSVEKNRSSSESTKAGSLIRRVLEIDSLDRSFKEDDLTQSIFTYNKKRNNTRQSINKSMIMNRSFKE